MHDVTGSALIARLDLPPTKDLMSKAEAFVGTHSVDPYHGSDPALETASDTTSVGTEIADGNEQTTVDNVPYTSPEETLIQTNTKDIALPVTPETFKTTDSSKGSDAEPEEQNMLPSLDDTKKKDLQNLTLGEIRPNRRRIVSLDRANEPSIDDDGFNSPASTAATDDERLRRDHSVRSLPTRSHFRSRSSKHDDDASSSDDDSSYFATHLPSPKSGRSFSLSSTGSAPARTSFYNNSASRESDASLSFSDESDEDVHQTVGVHLSPMIHPKGSVADMHLYPQRITRMHSVSSLVSSGSSEGVHTPGVSGMASASSVSSYNTNGTGSEHDFRGDLHDTSMGVQDPTPYHGYYYGNQSTIGARPTHPPMMQGYASISHDQTAPWTGGPAAHLFPEGPPMHGYGVSMANEPDDNGFRGDHSNGTFTFVYSEDDETEGGFLTNQYADGVPTGGNQYFQNTGASRGTQGSQNQSRGGYQEGSSGAKTSNKVAFSNGADEKDGDNDDASDPQTQGFKVYWQRWVMLFYMSLLNLLSDWTCYSVAPIALLTEKAFGSIDPEKLVVVFLGANAIATACEPIILARLGLRRTVLFGALFLMIGSIVKSGGVPPILQTDITFGHEAWRLYLGFFLVGLSQPLYQCTPALLSASWFPEKERTMATGVALNANQLGIGFAFIFGTLLVEKAEDIPDYFGLLSTISTLAFLGTLIQFDDAPPTPPSSSARVMKGSLAVNLPSIDTIVQSVRGLGGSDLGSLSGEGIANAPSPATAQPVGEYGGKDTRTRRRTTKKKENLLLPSPMMPGRVGPEGQAGNQDESSPLYRDSQQEQDQLNQQPDQNQGPPAGFPMPPGQPYPGMPVGMGHPGAGQPYPGMVPPLGSMPHPQYQVPYWDPRIQQQMQQQQAYYQQQYYYQQQQQPPPPPYYYPYPYPPHPQGYGMVPSGFLSSGDIDDGAEPIVTITNHHLDIDIRDDQVIRSTRACLSRPGFIHSLVSFTVSGIVINTLSTFMDYLVRLNGAPRTYTGIVGGSFQFIIMISSLIIGGQTDKTRAYYSVTIGMLVVGAFGLAECGVSLDADRGQDLRWSLLVVAALVGPLQPVSTELGVEVAYPLSENTVLVIQQLFSNLLSALFIPFFKALKDVGAGTVDDTDMVERPQYTFSFYLLIVLHTGATVFFATFNGKYLRYEHELQKEAEEERRKMEAEGFSEESPLLNNPVV